MKTRRWIVILAAWIILLVVACILLHLPTITCGYLSEPVTEGSFPLKERWRFEADGEITAELGAGDGKVLVRTNQRVYVLDARTGSQVWDTPVPSEDFVAPPLIGDGLVVIGCRDGVKALDADTGQVRWASQNPACLPAPVTPAALSETMVYVVRDSCDVQAYDRKTGVVVWNVDLPGARSGADLFLDEDRIYLTTSGAVLQIRDSATGALIEEIGGQMGMFATYQSGVLYGFNESGELVAFDTRARQVLWKNGGLRQSYAPLLAGQRLLVPTDSGYPMAFDARTGQLLWRAQTEEDIYQTPVVLNDTVYILGLGSGKIYALSICGGVELGHLLTGNKFVITGNAFYWRPVTTAGLLIFPVGRRVYAYGN